MLSVSTILGICITIAIFGSYIPQFYKIIKARSSYGISIVFIFLSLLSSITCFYNALVFHYDVIMTTGDPEQLMGLFQMGVQFSCVLFLTMIVTCFLPRPNFTLIGETAREMDDKRCRCRREYFWVFLGFALIIIFTVITCVFLFGGSCDTDGSPCMIWARILGVMSFIFVLVQYLPQIHKIYKTQNIGSISIVTICLQTIGNIVWTVYLMFQKESHTTTWLPFLATSILQALLLIECMYFDCNKRSYQFLQNQLEEEYDSVNRSAVFRDNLNAQIIGHVDDDDPLVIN